MSVGQSIYIGRESNQLEEVEAVTVHDASGIYTEYVDPQARGVVPSGSGRVSGSSVGSCLRDPDLIRLGLLHLIDHQHLYPPRLRHQLEPELFL